MEALQSKLEAYQLPDVYQHDNNSKSETSKNNELVLLDSNNKSNSTSATAAATTAASSTTTLLLREYASVRDEYLQRKVTHAAVAHASTTFEETSITFAPLSASSLSNCVVPSRDDQEALLERQQQLVHSLSHKASDIQAMRMQLQAKYAVFQEQRAELSECLLVVPSSSSSPYDDLDDNDNAMDDEEDVEPDYHATAALLEQLQTKRASLEVSIRSVQQSSLRATKDLTHAQGVWDKLTAKPTIGKPAAAGQDRSLDTTNNNKENSNETDHPFNDDDDDDDRNILVRDPRALERQQAMNASMKLELDQAMEMTAYYTHLRVLLEQWTGIRIVSVEPTLKPVGQPPQQSSNAASLDTDNNNKDDQLTMTVQLYNKYTVEIVLCLTRPMRQRNFTIHSATIVSDTLVVVQGPTIPTPSPLPSDDGDRTAPVTATAVPLRIPALHDLVQLVGSLPSGENLRVLLTETLARIRMVQERARELTVLLTLEPDNTIITQIGPFYQGNTSTTNNNKSAGVPDQIVVCSWSNLQITAVLRLSPDCPLTPGSVTVEELVGLGGWDSAVVARIRTTIVQAAQKLTSPVAVVQAIGDEIQRLQSEEGLQVPLTPPTSKLFSSSFLSPRK